MGYYVKYWGYKGKLNGKGFYFDGILILKEMWWGGYWKKNNFNE